MTTGLIGYGVSAAFMGALYGGVHTNTILKERYGQIPAVKRAMLVTSGAVLGAVINPIALPFYPLLCTMYSMRGCPIQPLHKYA
jgi:hypothetical protein